MSTSTEVAGATRSSGTARERVARLSSQVRTLRTRAGAGQLDRLMLIVGGLLMPLGVALILLGWAGASRTPLPFEQNDYLISGGILGLALVFGGGFVYFSYWQTVRVRESRQQTAQLTAALNRLESLLAGGAGAPGGAAGVVEAARTANRTFVATASGSIFHRRDCPAVAGRDDLKRVDVEKTNLRPCRICTPLD
ncbi:MAG TPA: hypothetical protein VG708_01005 [Mycobacteriales bacterium]|nr:hypothetical protein [Mycobacteriales bacterium]